MIQRTALFVMMTVVLALQSLAGDTLKLASVFTDHMVLQRDQSVPIWGWSEAGSKVTVEFGNQKKTATAGVDGKWRVTLDPLPASSLSRALRISTTSNQQPITITDVLVGDVWLCSGQSNMGMGVGGSANAEQEIANARYPEIRLFTVAQNPTLSPTNAVKGEWEPCSTQTVGKFSAAAYFFGRELHKELKIPIGLLHSSVGGTPAEAWTRLEALETIQALAERAEKEISQIKSQEDDNKRFVTGRAAWEKKYGVEPPPIAETARSWADPELKTDDWSPITLPNHWVQLGAKSGGVFWVRRDVTLPESAAGKPFGLGLNWVSEQYDTAFFNGVEVGHANDKAPDFYNVQRRYNVPGKLVKAGRNVIAVRIVSATERAGMWQWGHMLGLPVADQTTVDNKWLMKTESTFAPLPSDALKSRPKPNNIAFRCVSSALNNGMIAPLVPFAIKGAIWYQGENNASHHGEYRELLSLMIRDWRAQWGRSFPFIIQQLVNNGAPPKDANQTGSWPYLRQAQEEVAGSVPNCGIASGMELGSALTIHPPNKQDVGKRLALVALEITYGRKIEASGPRFESMKVEDGAIRVKFTHAKGLQSKGGPLKRFAVAGIDNKFVWADATIKGETVVVSSPQVPHPVAMRYAWADNPDGCNLFNGVGLPAFPFQAEPDTKSTIIIADFESGSWSGWTAEGAAFGAKPFTGAKPPQNLLGRKGEGAVNSWASSGDAATGKLTSLPLEISKPYISFLLGGGKESGNAALGVRLEVDGQVVRRATGKKNDVMEWVNWDVADLAGKTGRIIIEDASKEPWGHVVTDHFILSPFPMPAFVVAAPFGDHMVLQREKPVVVWGRGLPGDRIRVTFAGQTKETRADASNKWRVELDPMSASPEGRELTVEQMGGEKAVFTDVLVGEVWLASGQSNMGFTLRGCSDGSNVVERTNLPVLRFLQVPHRAERTPQDYITPPLWKPATPQNVGNLSGVAFFFARQIHERLGIPVGIIQSSFGGTAAEAWTSGEGLSRVSFLKQGMEEDLAKLAASEADPVKAADPKRFTLPFARSGGLFNAMINPLIPFTIRGAIWYQGESNAFRAEQYARLLPLMIADWRARFAQGDFPFYIVQLANYYDPAKDPAPTDKRSTDDWVARLREAQVQVVQTVPQTGLAVAIDVGEKSIHPLNKQDVGDRLARLALANTYGLKDVSHESPIYASMNREGAAIRVKFTGCPGGLMVASKTGLEPAKETPDAKMSQFTIADADRKFVWAEARIDGKDTVIVSSPAVPEPVAVRYAWSLNPEGANLYGRNGLPASPFRNDDWPLPVK